MAPLQLSGTATHMNCLSKEERRVHGFRRKQEGYSARTAHRYLQPVNLLLTSENPTGPKSSMFPHLSTIYKPPDFSFLLLRAATRPYFSPMLLMTTLYKIHEVVRVSGRVLSNLDVSVPTFRLSDLTSGGEGKGRWFHTFCISCLRCYR